jgi:RHS repeat-associated protein
LDGDHIALTFDGEGHQTERFLHGTGLDQVLAQENSNGEVLWALTDHQGSVRMLLDNNGDVINNITYDAFGNITLETNPEVNFRFSYTGRELDEETGLYNYRSRYYDPAVGEFVSEDTIGFAGGDANLSRYVGNSPVNFIDPSGFCSGGQQWILSSPPAGAFLDGTEIAQSGIDWKPVLGGAFEILKGAGAFAGAVIGAIGTATYNAAKDILDSIDNSPVGIYIPPEDQQQFDPNNINFGTYEPTVDPFGNVERFPRNPNDFLKGDTFTFPGSGNIKVKDYIETFPRGIDESLESIFFESSSPWRGKSFIEDGDSKKGWQHIDERHVTGDSEKGPGDLFAPGTTRTQLSEAAEQIVKKGTRISDPNKQIQTFEDRIQVNGKRDRVRVTVDSQTGEVITIFPVRSE